MSVVIDLANLDAEDFRSLIQAHKALMLETTPPESSHALLIDGLKAPGITVWDMRENGMLIGCGALKRLSDGRSGEIKAMHTVAQFRKGGLGRRMLNHLLAEARHLEGRGAARMNYEIMRGMSSSASGFGSSHCAVLVHDSVGEYSYSLTRGDADGEGPLWVEGVFDDNGQRLSPSGLVLSAILQGVPVEQFPPAPEGELLIFSPERFNSELIAAGDGWNLIFPGRFPDAEQWIRKNMEMGIHFGGAHDWATAIHPPEKVILRW